MKLLIVDDSRFSQIVASNLFKKLIEDVDIVFASDGKEGLKRYMEEKPEYVIVDLLMPHMDGRELVQLIREYDRDAKVFVVSADVQRSVKEEMFSYGVLDFINKPLNEEKVKLIYEVIKGDKDEGD